MPFPIDMLAVMLFLGYYLETAPDHVRALPASLAVAALSGAVLLAASASINHIALRLLKKPGRTANERRRIAFHAETGLRILLMAAFAAALIESALPWSASRALGLEVSPDAFAAQAFGLGCYVFLFFCAWLPMYGLHRLVSVGRWTRPSFLLHKARYNLFVLLVWLPVGLLTEWLEDFLAFLPLLFLLAAWSFPAVLARIWGCRPLPEGEILDSVRRLEAAAGVRFSRVFLWEPGGGHVQNAAAVGILPPFRYLFLTPALVRGMTGPELEAVILHELGHARKKHLLFYLFTSIAGINVAALAGAMLPLGGTGERFIVTAALILAYFRFVFGWLSRNMERQADLFALEKSGASRNLANALEKLGLAAGHIRLADSWHHLGIAQRVEFLRRAEREPALVRGHNAGVARIMAAGYVFSILLMASMVWFARAEYAAHARSPGLRAAEDARDEDVAHWRRVMRLMPDDARPPLELAYRLAATPGGREEALELAGEAVRLAGAGEVRAAAEKLLRELGGDGGGG